MPKDVIASEESRNLYKACMAIIREERESLGYTKIFTAQSICTPPMGIDTYSRYERIDHKMTPDLDIFFDLCKAVHLTAETVLSRARQRLKES
jgi:transcriptional regulator with XRE-family HTH domain